VQQDPEIFAVYAKFPANLVAVAFIEKNSFQEGSVSHGHTEQDLLDLYADLPRNCNGMRVGCGGCGLDCTLVIERLGAGGGAVVLEEDVIANGIDEGTETFRLAQGAGFSKAGKDAGKCLLAHVLNRLGGLQPRAELQMKQFGEVTNEMLLCAVVPSAESFDVCGIERMKLQGFPR
jgi:hypothetical protein